MKLLLCLFAIILALAPVSACADEATDAGLSVPANVRVLSRQWRVDLIWDEPSRWSATPALVFEVERAANATGPFKKCHNGYLPYCGHSDFLGEAGQAFHYRVRMVELEKTSELVVRKVSAWTPPVFEISQPLDEDKLLIEMQEAGFRYFYDAAHPVSGLPRSQSHDWAREWAATSAIGMGMFNIVLGVERGFVSRDDAARRVLRITDFLLHKAERYHGAYSHLINARSGKTIPFMPKDDGADLLETAYLIQGLLFAREYFDGSGDVEARIRQHSNEIWHGVDWTWFVRTSDFGDPVLSWHWSPKHEWAMGLNCHGFGETQILYLLALSSPTHRVDDELYWKGWRNPLFGGKNVHYGVNLPLQRIFNVCLFPAHYTYMGIDPEAIGYDGLTYHEIFTRWCTAQMRYMASRKDDFKGYGTALWGLTASANQSGYKAHAPGVEDDGTIAPTAALSSMPYVPNEAKACMMEMFTKHGKALWGPYGFFDAFNLTQDWVADRMYICIDVGPVGPMIENHLTGKCWEIFMKTPEVAKTLERIRATEPKLR
jgi:hypothetical protein